MMPRSRLSRQRLAQLRALLRRVVVDLVEHQHDRLVAGGQLRQGRVFGLVQIRIGDEQDQVGPAGGVVGHVGPLRAVDLVDARRVEQHDLRLLEAGHAVAAAVPRRAPDLLGPAAAHVDLGHGLAHQGVDQRRLAGVDLAEQHDLDAALLELLRDRLQVGQFLGQRRFFGVAAAGELLDRVPHAGHARRHSRGPARRRRPSASADVRREACVGCVMIASLPSRASPVLTSLASSSGRVTWSHCARARLAQPVGGVRISLRK